MDLWKGRRSSLNESRPCCLPTRMSPFPAFFHCSLASSVSPAGDKTWRLFKLNLVVTVLWPGVVGILLWLERQSVWVELQMRKCCFSDKSWPAGTNCSFLPVNTAVQEEAVQAYYHCLSPVVWAQDKVQWQRMQSKRHKEPGPSILQLPCLQLSLTWNKNIIVKIHIIESFSWLLWLGVDYR